MSKKKLILFPFGGNAREAVSIIKSSNDLLEKYELVGFVDDNTSTHGKSFAGIPVLGGKEALDQYPDAYMLAVQGSPTSWLGRGRIVKIFPQEKVSIIDPTAFIGEEVEIGNNCLIYPGVRLMGNVKIGDNVIIMANTVVSHDVEIGSDTMIGSNVSISGFVKIGQNCYIGSGSKLNTSVVLDDYVQTGLGSVVIRNQETKTVVAGVPSRKLREITN